MTVRWLIMTALLLCLSCACPELDPITYGWIDCADDLCGWQVDPERVRRAPTLHPGRLGLEVDGPTTLWLELTPSGRLPIEATVVSSCETGVTLLVVTADGTTAAGEPIETTHELPMPVAVGAEHDPPFKQLSVALHGLDGSRVGIRIDQQTCLLDNFRLLYPQDCDG